MKKNAILLVCLFLLVFQLGCEKEEVIINPPSNVDQFAPDPDDIAFMAEHFGMEVSADFIGRIGDDSGNAVFNAQVTIGDKTVFSDFNGVYIIKDATVYQKHALIKVKKAGYLESSRAVIPNTTAMNSIDVVMLVSSITGSVTSGEASIVEGPDNSKVEFTGDFVKSDGSVYEGQVNVYMSYVDPSDTNYPSLLPGNGIAQTVMNENVSIARNHGLLDVKLLSPSGERLNIDPQHPAIVYIPKTGNASSEPSTISLWSYNENLGFWEEDENIALSSGEHYVALVTHFSWWAASSAQNYVEFCFTLSPQGYEGDQPYFIRFDDPESDSLFSLYSFLIREGEEQCIMLPEGEEFDVKIRATALFCTNNITVYEDTIGPFSNNANADFSFGYLIDYVQLTGFANNCEGVPLQNGYVYIDDNNIFSITDGVIDFAIQHCITTEYVDVQIYDFDSNTVSVTEGVPLVGLPFNIGTVSTCDNTNDTFNGNVVLATQQQVEEFGAVGFKRITGSLFIGEGYGYMSDITDLTPLEMLEVVEGKLSIANNPSLTSLNGLSNLTSVDYDSDISVLRGLQIIRNINLTDISALNSLINVKAVRITNSQSLVSIEALSNAIFSSVVVLYLDGNSNLTDIPELALSETLVGFTLSRSDAITNLQFLQGITEFGGINLYSLPNLQSLNGLEQLESLEYFRISNCDSLVDFTELSSLTTVEDLFIIAGNDNLLSLNGLDNLILIEDISIGLDILDFDDQSYISHNTSLIDFCALQNLFQNGTYTPVFNSGNIFEGINIVHVFPVFIEQIQSGNCFFG